MVNKGKKQHEDEGQSSIDFETPILDDGEAWIDPLHERLWSFVYYILIKFCVPISFKIKEGKIKGQHKIYIQFFVPRGREDVAKYIQQEFSCFNYTETSEESSESAYVFKSFIHYYDGESMYIPIADVIRMGNLAMSFFFTKHLPVPDDDSKLN